VQPALNYRFEGGSTLSLAPKVRSYFSVANENSDYSDYAGHVDWHLNWAQDDGMMLSGMLRQGDGGRRTVQVDLAWPLRHTWLANMNGYLHMQYFNGYGETLRNYNERHKSQFRVGLMLIH
jgi:outer membrane phospholipase A